MYTYIGMYICTYTYSFKPFVQTAHQTCTTLRVVLVQPFALIYIYMHRETERHRYVCIHIYIYVYIYIYIERERERFIY